MEDYVQYLFVCLGWKTNEQYGEGETIFLKKLFCPAAFFVFSLFKIVFLVWERAISGTFLLFGVSCL